MKIEKEEKYRNMSAIGAILQDKLTEKNGMQRGFEKIATQIATEITHGKILEVGCGTGRLLAKLKEKMPQAELHGIDISKSMIRFSKRRLKNDATLTNTGIVDNPYSNNQFDCIVSSGSLHCWDKPLDGLNKIYHLLKPGQTAYIYDTICEYDPELVNINLQGNLVDAGLMRWLLSPIYLKKQLKESYSINQLTELILQSEFKNSYLISREVLGGLPIFVRIKLTKQA